MTTLDPPPRPTDTKESTPTMYEMYPEWGPAHWDDEHPANPANWTAEPVQTALDRRDNGGERPDDN